MVTVENTIQQAKKYPIQDEENKNIRSICDFSCFKKSTINYKNQSLCLLNEESNKVSCKTCTMIWEIFMRSKRIEKNRNGLHLGTLLNKNINYQFAYTNFV